MPYNRRLELKNFTFKEGVILKDMLSTFNEVLCKKDFFRIEIPESGKWKTVREAFEAWGFDFEPETLELSFNSGYLGDENKMFEALAKFVKEGSYIHSHDDFGVSRLVFDGNNMEERKPKWE